MKAQADAGRKLGKMAAIEVMQMPQWQLDQVYMRKSVSSDITSSDKILSRLFNMTSRTHRTNKCF